MLDLVRFVFFLAGALLAGAATWFTLKARVGTLEAALTVEQAARQAAEIRLDRAIREHIESAEQRLRTQVNGLGARVKRTEESDAEIQGHMDELRSHVDGRNENALQREALLRERVARLEARHEIPFSEQG